MKLTEQHAASLAEWLIFALGQYHRSSRGKHPLDTRFAEQLAHDLRSGAGVIIEPPEGDEMSGTGHAAGLNEPRMITIAEIVRAEVPNGLPGEVAQAQRMERKLRRWAEGGKVRGRLVGKTWLIDETEAREKLAERATA